MKRAGLREETPVPPGASLEKRRRNCRAAAASSGGSRFMWTKRGILRLEGKYREN
jgi:hypothetical protein